MLMMVDVVSLRFTKTWIRTTTYILKLLPMQRRRTPVQQTKDIVKKVDIFPKFHPEDDIQTYSSEGGVGMVYFHS